MPLESLLAELEQNITDDFSMERQAEAATPPDKHRKTQNQLQVEILRLTTTIGMWCSYQKSAMLGGKEVFEWT